MRHGTSLPRNLTITDMGKITVWECRTPGPIKIAADNPTIWRKAGKGVALVGIRSRWFSSGCGWVRFINGLKENHKQMCGVKTPLKLIDSLQFPKLIIVHKNGLPIVPSFNSIILNV